MATGKSTSLLALFLLVTLHLCTQPIYFNQHAVDRLEQLLPNATNDTIKVNNLMALSRIYVGKKEFDRSISYARMADTISQQLKYDRGRVQSLAYNIITKGHGGELKVETKEGEGSEFIIPFPR